MMRWQCIVRGNLCREDVPVSDDTALLSLGLRRGIQWQMTSIRESNVGT